MTVASPVKDRMTVVLQICAKYWLNVCLLPFAQVISLISWRSWEGSERRERSFLFKARFFFSGPVFLFYLLFESCT